MRMQLTALGKKSQRKQQKDSVSQNFVGYEPHSRVVERRGSMTVFGTINKDDMNWLLRATFAGLNVNLDTRVPLTNEQVRFMHTSVATDPSATARAATHFITNFVYNILLGGVFGKLETYYIATEEQGKGSLHWHWLARCSGVPNDFRA